MFQGTQYLSSQKIPCTYRFLLNIVSNFQQSANHTNKPNQNNTVQNIFINHSAKEKKKKR